MTKGLKFECKVGTARAIGVIVHKFKVLKGAKIQEVKRSLRTYSSKYSKKRNELECSGVIKGGKFTKDYEFDSPSEASCVILGTSAANFSNWKLCGGQSLHNIWDKQMRVRGKGKKRKLVKQR